MKKIIISVAILVFIGLFLFPIKHNVYLDNKNGIEIHFPDHVKPFVVEKNKEITFQENEYSPSLATIIIDAEEYSDLIKKSPNRYIFSKKIYQNTFNGDLYYIVTNEGTSTDHWLKINKNNRLFLVSYRSGGEWIVEDNNLVFTN